MEGAIYRWRTGIPWRDLRAEYGSWQTVHRRHQAWSLDGTWDRILAELVADADAAGELDWRVSVDSATARVHQHAATAARSQEARKGPSSHTGGGPESQEG